MGTDQIQVSIAFNGAGTFGDSEVLCGCIDADACNFNPEATLDDGSCEFAEEGFCNCDGQVLDACGVWRPWEVYECGCTDIPDGDCDCDGNQLDAVGVCGGDCAADEDNDGICDDVDDCIGIVDVLGCRNGPGARWNADAQTFLRVLATAWATNSTPLAFAAEAVRPTRTEMASATTWTIAWGCTTRAACATARATSTNVAVRTFQRAIAIATETSSTPWACVEGLAWPTSTPTGCAMLRKRDAATQARATMPQKLPSWTTPCARSLRSTRTVTATA